MTTQPIHVPATWLCIYDAHVRLDAVVGLQSGCGQFGDCTKILLVGGDGVIVPTHTIPRDFLERVARATRRVIAAPKRGTP